MAKTKKPVSYYDVLQISQNASDHDVKQAYYKMARRFHPDKNPQERRMAELRFRLINEAYASLKTKKNRHAYNKSIRQGHHSQKTAMHVANDDVKTPDSMHTMSSENWLSLFSRLVFGNSNTAKQ